MRARAVLLSLVSACLASDGFANGRFPATMSVTVHPEDSDALLVGATFGILLSTDGGLTWRWVCEDAVGYGGFWDPVFAFDAPSGAIGATNNRGMRVSPDAGCSWEVRGGDHASDWFSDVEVLADGTWLLTTGSSGRTNGVFRSLDQAASLEPTELASESEFFKSIESDATGERVYVVVWDTLPQARIERSDDGGETWSPTALTFGTEQVAIRAVDPSDPDRFYFTVLEGDRSSVRRSVDGGASEETVFDADGVVDAFAVSADGGTIVLGGAGTQVMRSIDGGASFEAALGQIRTTCFTVVGETLFSCAANWDDGFAVGKSDDWGDH
ncbi:MAG: hypothetical protein L0206_24100, partial [Actinobacteria bacterium]|nr:hypothetical protein [Actinomycetota bacterium]